MSIFIKAKNASLDFPLYEQSDFSFRNKITSFGKLNGTKGKKNNIIRGLDSINIKIKEGDKVAIIGANGSGKTTLLKLLSKIYSPSSGEVNINGKVCTMIDLGFGFLEDASGIENILLSKVIRGESIQNQGEIIENARNFSGLGEYLNFPIRTYSSGMKSRLALATALDSNPDILLIDEFFSTGDIEFAKKSKLKIMEIIDKSAILLFASHNLDVIEDICDKAIYMKNGKIENYGEVSEIKSIYINDHL